MFRVPRPQLPATPLVACAIGLAFWLLDPSAPRAATVAEGELQHFFGGQTVAVTVPCHAIPAHLEVPVRLRVQLVQRASVLGAPVGPPREITVARTADAPPAGPVQVDVALPSVERETGFELRIESLAAVAGEWRRAQPIGLRVHPQNLLAPLKTWSQKRRLRVVEDRGQPRLAEFLRRHDVRFETAGATPRPGAGPAVTLYAGKAARGHRPQDAAPGPAILLSERASGLPHIVVERAALGAPPTVTVEMPLLDRLETDPAAQQTFLHIFELLEARTDPR